MIRLRFFVIAAEPGARKGELRGIQWPQVDLASGLNRLPASQTKNKHPRTLPIYETPAAHFKRPYRKRPGVDASACWSGTLRRCASDKELL